MKKIAVPVVITAVFTAVALVFASIVTNALRSPVSGETVGYTATFSDVAGLFVGNDVRIAGVQVGKVETIRLNGRNADVGFTVLKDQPLYTDTVVAVRYQNLLGQRYVELAQPHTPGALIAAGTAIPLERTIASFDISKMFNGFRPLFQTLDPAQFNQFGEDMLRLIQGDGDGSGIGPVLRDLDAVSKLAVNRQAVFVQLMRNLGEVSAELGGQSKQIIATIEAVQELLATLNPEFDQIGAASDDIQHFAQQLIPSMHYLEDMIDVMTIPYYDFLMRVLPHTPAIIGAMNMLPSLLQGARDQILDGPTSKPNFQCSNGLAELPGVGEVPFGDQNLVLCR
ncbi:MAG: MlaD family protein [Segniliparus sp.]|uniref:MlaD family protein n=1 Tax=Segniliparus sp. TaxID=2804064 RepID=UPI003F3CE196